MSQAAFEKLAALPADVIGRDIVGTLVRAHIYYRLKLANPEEWNDQRIARDITEKTRGTDEQVDAEEVQIFNMNEEGIVGAMAAKVRQRLANLLYVHAGENLSIDETKKNLKISLPLIHKKSLFQGKKGNVDQYHSPLSDCDFVLKPTGRHQHDSGEKVESSSSLDERGGEGGIDDGFEATGRTEVSNTTDASGVHQIESLEDPRKRAKKAFSSKVFKHSAFRLSVGEIDGKKQEASLFAKGKSLRAVIESGVLINEQTEQEVLLTDDLKNKIAYQLALAVQELHESDPVKLFHMDLKPENIIVELLEDGLIKVTLIDHERVVDSKGYEQLMDQQGVRGTPSFMPPEAYLMPITISKSAAGARDFYSFGRVLGILYNCTISIPQITDNRSYNLYMDLDDYQKIQNKDERRQKLAEDLLAALRFGADPIKASSQEGAVDQKIIDFIESLLSLKWEDRPKLDEFIKTSKEVFSAQAASVSI